MNPTVANADQSAPPLPPDVQQQQEGNPLQQYGRNAAQRSGFQQNSSLDFVGLMMKEIAERLQKVALVLNAEAPEIMPIWRAMVGAGKQLEEFVQKKKQGESQASSPGLAPSQAAMQPSEGPPGMSY